MTFARIFLWLAAAMSIAGGIAYLVSPAGFAEQAGFGPLQPGGTTDVRATYGGLQLGMGIFLVWSAWDTARLRTGIVLVAMVFGALAICRAIGVAIDDSLNDFHTMGLVFEFALTGIALAAVATTRRQQAAA